MVEGSVAMKRYAINRLQEWKEDPYRLPMTVSYTHLV